VGLQRVGRDDRAGQVQGRKQRPECADLLGGAGDLALGQHGTGGVVHRRHQVHGPAAVRGAGAAQGLAVDGHGPPSVGGQPATVLAAVAVGQPGADGRGQGISIQARKGAADGGLGRDGDVVGGVAPGAERGADALGCVGGPFGDRGDGLRAGQDRGGGQGEDSDQGVAAAAGCSWVGDGGEVGQ
jgi:hypothetical protein